MLLLITFLLTLGVGIGLGAWGRRILSTPLARRVLVTGRTSTEAEPTCEPPAGEHDHASDTCQCFIAGVLVGVQHGPEIEIIIKEFLPDDTSSGTLSTGPLPSEGAPRGR